MAPRAKRKAVDAAGGGDGTAQPQAPEIIQIDQDEPALPKSKQKDKVKKKVAKQAVATAPAKPKQFIKTVKYFNSLRDKIYRIFGSNQRRLSELIKLRDDWETSMFTVPDELLSGQDEQHVAETDVDIGGQFDVIDEIQFKNSFNNLNSIKFQIDDEPQQVLKPDGSTKSDRALIINAGALTTGIVWAPHQSSPSKQYLIVSVSNEDSVISTDLQFLTKQDVTGDTNNRNALLVYEVDTVSRSASKVKTILHDFGTIICLKTAPIRHGADSIIISTLSNDGVIRIIDITLNSQPFIHLHSTYEFKINEKITSFDWFDGNRIIFGTILGNIGEFVFANDTERCPSFLYPISNNSVIQIISGENKSYGETIFFATISDGFSILFSISDIEFSKNKTQRNKTLTKTSIFSKQLNAFLMTEGSYPVKMLSARAMFVNQPVVKHEGSVESLASSTLHPMLLSGGADGEIKINNLSRRILNAQKPSLSSHKICKLWKLDYNEGSKYYRLDSNIGLSNLNVNENLTSTRIFPNEISINSINWNPNKAVGNYYAASSTFGVIIVEKLV